MHPKRPRPIDIKAARRSTGLTREEAAFLVYTAGSVWASWELEKGHRDHRVMHPAFAELFAFKTGLKKLEVLQLELKEVKSDES